MRLPSVDSAAAMLSFGLVVQALNFLGMNVAIYYLALIMSFVGAFVLIAEGMKK